ncbi:SPOR domain-containing protein [Vibrio sp. SM6]|uniref:SPOR domain-containing protein n=1 Tax=Vibrio agarilyticus TaxID=2726741 RepID=A0A7X8YH72_9VIBR|nr:SPOR domain-containing protein [Vibrio agarilyticus]NLS13285.1 SPOR domain-containing protein [Vibrio agarilyticus]
MASQFQNRLVGTIILVTLGVIVLPDLLDGEKQHYTEEFAAIPIKPALSDEMETYQIQAPISSNVALPDSPVVMETPDDQQVTQAQVAQANKEPDSIDDNVTTKVVPVIEKNDFQDSGWIIQLMALKNAENAEKVVNELREQGYQAHTKKERSFTRVIVGPDVSKSKLERQIKELEKITGSKGQLLKFKPLNP